jgi:hypothetical protein
MEIIKFDDSMIERANGTIENRLTKEIEELKEQVNELELVKLLKQKEEQLREVRRQIIQEEKTVLEWMKSKNIKSLEINEYKFKIRTLKTVETVVENLDLVPEEFLRVRKDVDKVKAKKLYLETGVLTPGLDFVHNETDKIVVEGVRR